MLTSASMFVPVAFEEAFTVEAIGTGIICRFPILRFNAIRLEAFVVQRLGEKIP